MLYIGSKKKSKETYDWSFMNASKSKKGATCFVNNQDLIVCIANSKVRLTSPSFFSFPSFFFSPPLVFPVGPAPALSPSSSDVVKVIGRSDGSTGQSDVETGRVTLLSCITDQTVLVWRT